MPTTRLARAAAQVAAPNSGATALPLTRGSTATQARHAAEVAA